MTRRIDIDAGTKFGEWTFIEPIEGGKGSRKARCVCKCGSVHEVYIGHLRHGRSTQCKTCYSVKHNMHKTPTYKSWVAMMSRCYSKNTECYAIYGGRGITVCDEWHSFEGFFKDMGNRPAGKTLDRVNVNGGYSKENCRWATPTEQQNNTRTNHVIEYEGETYTVAELARHLGLKYHTLSQRVRAGTKLDRPLRSSI